VLFKKAFDKIPKRYQRGNQKNNLIEEGLCPKEKGQKDKQRSTKYYIEN
jgi:hypothetical protein